MREREKKELATVTSSDPQFVSDPHALLIDIFFIWVPFMGCLKSHCGAIQQPHPPSPLRQGKGGMNMFFFFLLT